MKKDIRISIIVPSKDRPEYIKKIVDLKSKINFSELIIIENNSSVENVKKYKIICKDNDVILKNVVGIFSAGDARNFGAQIANGDYLFFLDDDDYPTPEFINFLNENIAFFSEKIYRFSIKYDSGHTLRIKNTMQQINLVQPSSFLVDRKFVLENKIEFAARVVHQDSHFSEMVCSTGEKQVFIKIHSIIYNTKTESITRSKKTLAKEVDSILEFEKPKYKNGGLYMFKIVLYVSYLAKNFEFDVPKADVNKKMLSIFKNNIKNKRKVFFKLPLDKRFAFILWCFKSVFKKGA